jgi:hypothetical protein
MLSKEIASARQGRDLVSLLRDSDIGCSEECLCEQAATEIARLRAALKHAEAVLSIVPPRSDKREYLECLSVVREALK